MSNRRTRSIRCRRDTAPAIPVHSLEDHVMNKLNTSLLASALALGVASSANAADTSIRETAVPTVILVHGAFADGSSWNKVIPLLQAQGLKAIAVQNPLSSLEDDVAAVDRALEVQTGPVVLVGHSWAGTVITQAGGNEKVKSLVYVASFAPSLGESSVTGQGFSGVAWSGEVVASSEDS